MSGEATLHDGRFRLDPLSARAARVPIGPVRIGDHVVEMRQHRWSDGPQWRATRLQDEARFRPAFGSADRSWADSSSLASWVEHMTYLRRSRRAGLMVAWLVLHDDGRVLGEITCQLDPASGSGEISLWFERETPRPVVQWITSSALFRVFALPARIPRVLAPIASQNPGPRRLLGHFGFHRVAVARELRAYDGVRVDHDVLWLERTADHLDGLVRGLTDPTL